MEGDTAPLMASPSEIRQRFESVVAPGKAQAFWRDWTANFIDASDFQRLKRQGFQRRASTVECQFLTKPHCQQNAAHRSRCWQRDSRSVLHLEATRRATCGRVRAVLVSPFLSALDLVARLRDLMGHECTIHGTPVACVPRAAVPT
jgi:hypothetical protein